jgi:hypothetical protein
MARDNAPITHTCPAIDAIIGLMKYARGEAEYITKYPEEDNTAEARTIIDKLNEAINDMENVRSDNAELRDWGNEEYYRADYAEGERDDALRENELLQDENEELKAKIKELENELSAVEL